MATSQIEATLKLVEVVRYLDLTPQEAQPALRGRGGLQRSQASDRLARPRDGDGLALGDPIN